MRRPVASPVGLIVVLLLGLSAPLVCAASPQQAEQTIEIVGSQGKGLARVADLLAPITGPDWLNQPSSLSVISVAEGRALGALRMVDLMQQDPSVELNYAPVGYYESLQVRGFAVDPVLGYRINGLPVVGEVPFWMRPYQTLEFVRGPVGAWLGSGAGGGLINLVTVRPGAARSAELELTEHGAVALAADLSGSLGRWGAARVVLEQGQLRPAAAQAKGDSQGVSLGLDGEVGPWQVEIDLQRRQQSQVTQPGSQLLAGLALPPLQPDLVLGHSRWSEPTVFRSTLLQLRLSSALPQVASGWESQLGLSRHVVETDDRSSFPWGCSNGRDPYYLFCGNGDFTLWDYASLHERRAMDAGQALAYGPLSVLGWRGQGSLGVSALRRSTQMPTYSWQPTDAGYVDTGNVFQGQWSGTPLPRSPYEAFRSVLQQRTAWVSWTASSGTGPWALQPGLTVRSVSTRQGYESAFWTPRPWSVTHESRLLAAASLGVTTGPDQRWTLGWREDLEAGQRVPVTAANDGELLAPRVLRVLELGYKWRGERGARVSVTAFRSERPYDLRADEIPNAAAPGAYTRRGLERRSGLEWVIQEPLSRAWSVEWTGSWTASEVTGTGLAWLEGTAAPNLPSWRTRLQLARAASEQLPGVQVAASISAARWANRGEGVRVPGYRRLDAGLTAPPAWTGPHLRLRLSVQNLLNQRYWADASEFLGDAYLTPGPSRTVILTVSSPL